MITAAFLSANCFMQVPEAKGHINIELDKVLAFFSFLFMFYIPPPPFLTLQQHPQVSWLQAEASTYFKKLQLPYDRSAKRFSFNINQQTCKAETCRRVSLPQKCLHPGINLKFRFAAKLCLSLTIKYLNLSIFSPLYFCPLISVPPITLSKQNTRIFPLLDATACCYTNFQRESERQERVE